MKRLIVIVFACISLESVAQIDYSKVDQTEFLGQLMKHKSAGDSVKMVFWIPSEYWDFVNSKIFSMDEVPQESIDFLKEIFDNNVVVLAGTLKAAGTEMLSTGKYTLSKRIKLELNNQRLSPIPFSEYDDVQTMFADMVGPIFQKMLGQMGNGLHLFLFEIDDDTDLSLLEKNTFKIHLSGESFVFDLPLSALLPKKHCAVDNEEFSGKWNYCPIHGNELK